MDRKAYLMLALAAPCLIAASPVAGGPWTITSQVDQFTDVSTTVAAAKGKGGTLTLLIMCDKDRELTFTLSSATRSFGAEDRYGRVYRTVVDFRVDAEPLFSVPLPTTGRFAVLSPASGEGAADRLIDVIAKAKGRILVRAPAINDSVLSDEFSARNSSAAIAAARRACGR